MSAVLCLPACLCVSAAASRGQAPPREGVSKERSNKEGRRRVTRKQGKTRTGARDARREGGTATGHGTHNTAR